MSYLPVKSVSAYVSISLRNPSCSEMAGDWNFAVSILSLDDGLAIPITYTLVDEVKLQLSGRSDRSFIIAGKIYEAFDRLAMILGERKLLNA